MLRVAIRIAGISLFVTSIILPIRSGWIEGLVSFIRGQNYPLQFIITALLGPLLVGYIFGFALLYFVIEEKVDSARNAIKSAFSSLSGLEKANQLLAQSNNGLNKAKTENEKIRGVCEALSIQLEESQKACKRANEIAEYRLKQLIKIRDEALGNQISDSGLCKELNNELSEYKRIIEEKNLQLEAASQLIKAESAKAYELHKTIEEQKLNLTKLSCDIANFEVKAYEANQLAEKRLKRLRQYYRINESLQKQLDKERNERKELLQQINLQQNGNISSTSANESGQSLAESGDVNSENIGKSMKGSHNSEAIKKSGFDRLIDFGKHIVGDRVSHKRSLDKSKESAVNAKTIENLWPEDDTQVEQLSSQSIWITLKERNKGNSVNSPHKGEIRYYRIIEAEASRARVAVETTRLNINSWQKLDLKQQESMLFIGLLKRLGINDGTIDKIYAAYGFFDEGGYLRYLKIQW